MKEQQLRQVIREEIRRLDENMPFRGGERVMVVRGPRKDYYNGKEGKVVGPGPEKSDVRFDDGEKVAIDNERLKWINQ